MLRREPQLLLMYDAPKGMYAFNEYGDVLVHGNHRGCDGWWQHEDVWVYNPNFTGVYNPIVEQPDHSWMEVIRFPTRKTGVGCDGGGYGCWFFGGDGSGVSINIGRSARFKTKEEAREMVGRAGGRHALYHALDPCRRHGCDGDKHSDTYICAAAKKLGFDSVMWSTEPRAHQSGVFRNIVEIVVCHDWCMQNVSCDECPGIDLRASDGSTCHCNASIGFTNCNLTLPSPPCTTASPPSSPPSSPPPPPSSPPPNEAQWLGLSLIVVALFGARLMRSASLPLMVRRRQQEASQGCMRPLRLFQNQTEGSGQNGMDSDQEEILNPLKRFS